MSFSQSIIACLSKYIDFKGRASRSEFWWFQLFVVLIQIPFTVLLMILGSSPLLYSVINVLSYALAGLLFLPNLTVTTRRLHDTNRSGWWQLVPWGCGAIYYSVALTAGEDHIVALITLLGAGGSAIALLFWLSRKSDVAPNKHGEPTQVSVITNNSLYQTVTYNSEQSLKGICPKCGTSFDDDHIFCISCGARLAE